MGMKDAAHISVEAPRYQGVEVDNPTIVAYIRNMIRQHRKTDDIARIVGMPHVVIRKYEEEAARERQGAHK